MSRHRLRRALWKLHSIAGLISAVGLLVIGFTGTILVLHEDLDRLLFPEVTRVTPLPEGKLPWSERVRAVEQAFPEHAVTGWALQREDDRAAEGVYVMPWGTREWRYLTMDPYTGDILSEPVHADATFKHWILDLHSVLLMDHVGMALSGLLGVLLCFLGLSGLWIYRRFWKMIFTLRWKGGVRLLWGNVHRLTGVLSVGTNLLLGATGAYWNLTHLVEEWLHPHHDPADEAIFHEKLYPDDFPLDEMLANTDQHIAGFEAHYVSMPWAKDGQFTLWGRHREAGWFRSLYGSQISLSANDATVLHVHDLRKASWWAQVKDSFEPLHFGDFGGPLVKLIYALAGLAPGVLAVSGIAIWWKRRTVTPQMKAG